MAADHRDYLAAQGFQDMLTAAVKTIITEKPTDAKARLVELLMAPPEESEPPKLTYFPMAGRGELTKMCAAVGGVKYINNVINMGDHVNFGPNLSPKMPMTVPICQHGSTNFFESLAIETYFCNLSPKFSALPPKAKLMDDVFANIKEDVQQATPKFLFGPDDVKATVKEAAPPIFKKAYDIAEGLCPESGFVNGLDWPTKADLAILNMARGATPPDVHAQLRPSRPSRGMHPSSMHPHLVAPRWCLSYVSPCDRLPESVSCSRAGVMPYLAVMTMADYDFAAAHPKMARIAAAAAEYPAIKEYLVEGNTLDADPMGFMPK